MAHRHNLELKGYLSFPFLKDPLLSLYPAQRLSLVHTRMNFPLWDYSKADSFVLNVTHLLHLLLPYSVAGGRMKPLKSMVYSYSPW